jgi:spermidine synthase
MLVLTSLKDKLLTFGSYLTSVTVFTSTSIFNQDIKVIKNYGQNELWINKIRQSGGHITGLWNLAFGEVNRLKQNNPKSFIIFGVGGGTVLKLIHKMYPAAIADAVDIDAEVIRIGKRYFGLDKLGIRNFYCADASKLNINASYDFIVIDLYNGEHVPDFVLTSKFLKQIKQMLNPSGSILINYYDDQAIHRDNDLNNSLNKIYRSVKKIPVYQNMMFLASV